MDTLPSREWRKRFPTLSGQRGITPAFGYGAPHPGARGTLTLLNNVLLSTHYEPRPTPGGAALEVIYSPQRLGSSRLAPAPPGLPGSSADLSPRAVSSHPGRSDECSYPLLPHRCQASPLSGGLATFHCITGPKRVRLTLRLTSSPWQGFARGITPTHACRATCRTGNLQGELLSVHKIGQASPGTPERRYLPLAVHRLPTTVYRVATANSSGLSRAYSSAVSRTTAR